MNADKVKKAIGKLDDILKLVRNQNSGADIHTIGNIRNVAGLLKEQLETDPNCLKEELVDVLISNTERKVSEFYKQKYTKKSM